MIKVKRKNRINHEYEEGSLRFRNDGRNRRDIEELQVYSDDIFEEVGEAVPEAIRKGKAGGGRMGYAGGKKVVEGLISLLNKKAGKDESKEEEVAIPKKTLDRDMFKKFDDRNPDQNRLLTDAT